jgi:hypothetical protein
MNHTQPGDKYLSAILSAILSTVATGHANNARAAVIAVANCNDSGPGSLRNAVAGAASGDTIDMTGLACRKVDLTSGAIQIAQNDLSLVGGPPALMKVDAGRRSSVFRHSGTGTLYIKRMNIARGVHNSDTEPLGGCLYSAGNIELVSSVVHGCRTRGIRNVIYGAGGGIYARGAVKLVYSQVVGNLVRYGYFSAIFANRGLMIFHSRVCRNYAGGSSVRSGLGTVWSGNGLIARYTTFCDNRGGGVWVQRGPVFIANSTISGNFGSGILAIFPGLGSTTIVDSTISGNTDPYGSPIVDIQRRSAKSITNSTIAFNQQLDTCGPFFGTVRARGGDPMLIDSTIVSQNFCNDAPGYAITTFEQEQATLLGANNLITGPSNMALPADTIAAVPRLAPLADNGGPTMTHALLSTSPAIDRGNNAAGLNYDQRGPGFPRVKGPRADIGAFE